MPATRQGHAPAARFPEGWSRGRGTIHVLRPRQAQAALSPAPVSGSPPTAPPCSPLLGASTHTCLYLDHISGAAPAQKPAVCPSSSGATWSSRCQAGLPLEPEPLSEPR